MNEKRAASELARRARIGLCLDCRHARTVVSARGSEFWLCERSARNPRYPKYPPLPVVRCAGWEPALDGD